MKENIEKIKNYFASILGVNNVDILVGNKDNNIPIENVDSKYSLEEYFNKKNIFFNSSTNTIMTFCPYNGGSWISHNDIFKLECDDYFKWIILYYGFDEDFIKSTKETRIIKRENNDIYNISSYKVIAKIGEDKLNSLLEKIKKQYMSKCHA